MTAVDATPGERRRQRTMVTPEGLELRLELASVGQRLGALIIDLMIIGGVTVAAIIGLLLIASAAGRSAGELVLVVFLLGMFGLRNGYFLAYEMSAKAATPGKRILGLRVAARDGGRLRFDAVFTRNALRELELFLPMSLILSGPFNASGGVSGWIYLLSLVWCAVFVFLPVFNADRLRAGDMVAGTWVLRAPRQKLLRDMADDGAVHRSDFDFTPAQLDVYGVKELQVLEQVLRAGDRATLRAVADRISAKIGYDRGMAADGEFLRAYYHGVRGRLESRLLMGRRRKDKFDAA